MGNTQKGIKGQMKKLFRKKQGKQEGSEIKQSTVCPKCLTNFPGVSPDFYALHVETCKQSMKQQQLYQPSMKQQELLPQHIKTSTENEQHVFEKIPTNIQNTQFKWVRVPVIKPNPQALVKRSPDYISSLSFQQKLCWMRYNLQRKRISWQHGADTMKVQKDNVLMTSIIAASKVNMYKEVKIQFSGDKVNDAGGLLRQWMHMIIKQMFDQTGIFQKTNTTQVMYKIKWDKDLDFEFAQSLFSLFGTILGKAIFQRIPLTCYIDKTLIRHLCGQPVKLQDIHGYDKDFYKNWKYLAINKIQPFGQYFSVMKQHSDHTIQIIPLVPGGQQIQLDQSNKKQFIERCIQFYCTETIIDYVKAIQKSLYKIIPQQLLSVFYPHELEMILYGVPFVNVDDWKNNTQYKGAYYKNHQIIKWFWNAVEQMSQQQLCNLLHFITGSSRIPIYGFQKLQSNRGNYAKFLIQSVPVNKANPYPKAHTCFNRLQLPMYPKEQTLKIYLFALVNNNLDGVYGLD